MTTGIQYSAVARRNIILTSHQSGNGHFENVAESMLQNVPDQPNLKVTYTSSSYLFHVVGEDGLIFLCVTDPGFRRGVAYSYLEEIRTCFNQTTLLMRAPSARAHELDIEFEHVMEQEMEAYSSGRKGDQMSQLRMKVDEVKGVMTENIEKVLERGDKLDDLVLKTQDLEESSIMFRSTAKKVRRKYWWRNFRMWIILILIVLVIITLIVLFATNTIPTS